MSPEAVVSTFLSDYLCGNSSLWVFTNEPLHAHSQSLFPMKDSTMNTHCWTVNLNVGIKNLRP